MRILHKDDLANERSASMFYSKLLQVLNHNGLELMHPNHMEFASLLTDTHYSQITNQMTCRRRNQTIVDCKENVHNDMKLRLKFDN